MMELGVQSWGALAETVRRVVREFPRLRLSQGRMVFEVRPTIKWDKGKALEFLLDSLGTCSVLLLYNFAIPRRQKNPLALLRRRFRRLQRRAAGLHRRRPHGRGRVQGK